MNTIRSRYYANLPAIVAYCIFIVFLFLEYRVRIYYFIQALYPEIQLKGLCEYLSLGAHYDSITVFYTLLTYVILIFLFNKPGKIRHIILSAFSIMLIFFMLFSIEFFRVYQTTFQPNYAGEEHITGLRNIIDSALAEFSTEFYILFCLLSLFICAMNYALWRLQKSTVFTHMDTMRPDPITSGTMKLLLPALLIFLLLAQTITEATIPYEKFAARYEKDRVEKAISILREFSMNPLYNLVAYSPPVPSRGEFKTGTDRGPFAFRLNTASLASDRRYGRLDCIPRLKKYNIILYFFESTPHKYYDIKINGRYVIASWRRLEKNSINFRKHYANYPLSANALVSVFASAYDLNFKDSLIQKYPDIKLRTLPEILKDQGYRTCLIHTGGLGYAGQKRFLKNRKFDSIIEYGQLITIKPYNQKVGWGMDERAMIKPGIEFIKKNPAKPFLLVCMPVNPHHPYAIPENYFKITGPINEDIDFKTRNWLNYLNSLHYADASLGMLVDELEREGLMDDTLLFIFADHGEAFYQHKMNYNHPLFIYDENVHVPFLIYNRKIFPSPLYFDGITRHIDILPTILDILGITRNPEQEGISILAPHQEQLALLHTSWKDDYMGVADRKWKYISRTYDQLEELYDLEADPAEKNNIAAQKQDIVALYRAYIQKARKYKDDYYRRILKK